jgi:hypothetical protein
MNSIRLVTLSLSLPLLGPFFACAVEKHEEAVLSPEGAMMGKPSRNVRSEGKISEDSELGEVIMRSVASSAAMDETTVAVEKKHKVGTRNSIIPRQIILTGKPASIEGLPNER